MPSASAGWMPARGLTRVSRRTGRLARGLAALSLITTASVATGVPGLEPAAVGVVTPPALERAPLGGAVAPVPRLQPLAVAPRRAPAGRRVAVLVRPALLRSRPGGGAVAARVGLKTEFGSPTVLAALGHAGGWLRVLSPQLGNGRSGWLRAADVRLVPDRWSVHADLASRTVTVSHAGRVVRRFPVTIGAPGSPTPVGRFAVTDKLRMAAGSPYGCCVLALSAHQPNPPAGWPGGDRIAIHAGDLPSGVGVADSAGCLGAREEDARWIVNHVLLGTIVTIG